MATMAQLNVRMDPELKARGDSVLDLYGISPSEIIRTLWQKIALGDEALRQVAETLAAHPAAGSTLNGSESCGLSPNVSWIVQRKADFEREMGLDPTSYEPLTDEQLNDLVYEDYLEEREKENAC